MRARTKSQPPLESRRIERRICFDFIQFNSKQNCEYASQQEHCPDKMQKNLNDTLIRTDKLRELWHRQQHSQ